MNGMTHEEPLNCWAAALRHIAASRYYLPPRLEGKARDAAMQMEHFLHHNEFGLALDEAEALGDLAESNQAYWEELRLAARSMGLEDAAARFARRL